MKLPYREAPPFRAEDFNSLLAPKLKKQFNRKEIRGKAIRKELTGTCPLAPPCRRGQRAQEARSYLAGKPLRYAKAVCSVERPRSWLESFIQPIL